MSRSASILFAAFLFSAIQVGGPSVRAAEIVLEPVFQSDQIDAPDSAEHAFNEGRWHMIDRTSGPRAGQSFVTSDAGYFGPAFLQFQLGATMERVSSGSLSLTITGNSMSDRTLILWDVGDVAAVLPTEFDTREEFLNSFAEVKTDLTSGSEYGATIVPGSDTTPTPFQLNIALSEAGIEDINALVVSGLPTFGIGLGPGSDWHGELEAGVGFSDVELRLITIPEPNAILLIFMGLTGLALRKRMNQPRFQHPQAAPQIFADAAGSYPPGSRKARYSAQFNAW
jgi:hypothetical protein